MEKPIKIIAIDIDGTLLDDDYQCDRETIEQLQSLEKQGIKVLLCTGRPLKTTFHMAKEMGIASYLITDNGAIIYRMEDEKPLLVREFSSSTYQRVIRILESTGIHLDVTSLEGMYAFPHGQEILNMYNKYKVSPSIVSEMDQIQEPIVKATLYAEPGVLDHVFLDLPKKLEALPVQCFRSGPTFIDVMHKESTKGIALHYLSHQLNISAEHVMAIGNYYNDLDMIQYAGIGVAMENSPQDVKDSADYVTASNNQQGVRKALLEWIVRRTDENEKS